MRHAVSLFGLMLTASPAPADIFKCLDESGHATYSNVQARKCQRVIASPPTAPAPARTMVPSGVKPGTPADFPRVDPATQRSRDDGRRRILDTELANEQKALDDARRQLADVQASGVNPTAARDRVALHERNVEALRKEIGNLK